MDRALVLLVAPARSCRVGVVGLQGGSPAQPWAGSQPVLGSSETMVKQAVNVGAQGQSRDGSCWGRDTPEGLRSAHIRVGTL